MPPETATAEIVRHPELREAPRSTPLMVISSEPGAIPQRPVIAAIAKVMHEVGAVEKRGNNQFHGYKYATAADVAHALQRLMAENGIVTIQREIGVNHDNDTGILAVRYEFTVMHSSGDALDPVQMTGMSRAKDSKGGFDDKAANKCHTAARKYFLLGLYNIPSGDYPDPDADEAPPAQSRVVKHRETKQTPSPPPAGDAAQPPAPSTTQPGASEPATFELVDGDGEIRVFTKLRDYITGIKLAVSGAADKGAVWSDNAKAFEDILIRAKKKGATEAVAALEASQAEINATLA